MARRKAKPAITSLPMADNVPQPVKPTIKGGTDLEMVDNTPQVGKLQEPAGFTPKGLKAEPKPGFAVYRVNRAISQLSHGDKVYHVLDGMIDLPVGETWYTDLINSGALTPA
jgi:hypothetical protein